MDWARTYSCYTLSNIRTTVFCVTVLLSAAPSLGFAQDETLLFQDLTRVTGASRYEQDTRDAPASITIVTAEDIRRYGYRTLGEVLANVRGFVVNDDRNYSYVGVRGFAVPGDYNSRVLFLLDGHPTNEGVFESALIGQGALIDLRVVDRIEIVRGPSSSVYGTSALFGVVNIVTLKGRALKGIEAVTAVGTWGTARGALTAGHRAESGFEILASATMLRSTGQDLYFPQLAAPATNDGYAIDADAERADRQYVSVVWGDYRIQAGRSWRQKRIPTGSFQTLFNDPRALTRDARAFGLITYDRGFTDASHLTVSLGYDADAYAGRYPYADGLFTDYARAQWWSGNAQYVRRFGAHRVLGGSELRWYTHQDQGGDNVDSGTVVFRSRRDGVVWAFFAQDEWRMARSLLVSAGLRLDHYETFGATTNPRVSVVYQLGTLGALKLLYGTAFRAPTAYELDYQDNGISTKSPSGLRPERVESYELVFEGVPTPGLHLTASAYQLHMHDLVSQVTDPADSLLVFRNLGSVRTRGIELDADVRLLAGLSAGFNYTLQHATDFATGAQRPGAPRHLLGMRLSVPAARDRLRASVNARYASAQHSVAGVPIRGATVTDVSLRARPTERVVLMGTVYNLFDASYGQPGGSEQVVPVIPQNRRHVRLTLQVQF